MRIHLLYPLGLAIFLGCGGGSLTMTTQPPNPPLVLAGFVEGNAAGLQMNNQPLDISGSSVTVTGDAAIAAGSLQPGVEIRAVALPGSLPLRIESAEVRPQLRGPISAVDLTAGTLTVLGRKVVVTSATKLFVRDDDDTRASLSLADFKVGNVVLVFGSDQPDDSLLATRVELQESDDRPGRVAMRGKIVALDTAAKTFTLHGLLVNYQNARVEGTLANGTEVLARGSLSGTTLMADRVVVLGEEASTGARIELRGPVTNLDATAKTFMIVSITVDYSQASLEGGPLANGAVVEVEGTPVQDQPGRVLASKVEIEEPPGTPGSSTGEAKGVVTAVDPTAMTLSLMSRSFWLDDHSLVLKGGVAIPLAQVHVGDWVEVLFDGARLNTAGLAYALRVEVQTPLSFRELEGTITAFHAATQTFELGGFTVGVTATNGNPWVGMTPWTSG